MSGVILTWRGDGELAPGDGAMLRPDTLGRLEPDALAATTMQVGRTQVTLGELFEIERHEQSSALVLRNLPPLPRIGEAMAGGELIIEGDAGDELGASMRGGLIRVRGSAGARVGAPAPTSRRGMTGGEIVIEGDAGEQVGYRMRRGLIVVTGRCGRCPGYQMLAGTIVCGRAPLEYPGLEMCRGTIICCDTATPLEPGEAFTADGTFATSHVPFAALVARRLRELGLDGAMATPPERVRLWSGDRFELHRGELCQWQR